MTMTVTRGAKIYGTVSIRSNPNPVNTLQYAEGRIRSDPECDPYLTASE